MRIIGTMVTRNEAGRYLEASLRWMTPMVDGIFVYDDGSTDDTCRIASKFAVTFGRTAEVPSFHENEAGFRQAAWEEMSEVMGLRYGDWVLSLDADEFLVAANEDWTERDALEAVVHRGPTLDTFPVAEVFENRDNTPMVRTDGYWGGITARRFIPWLGQPAFAGRTEGGGSLPLYAKSMHWSASETLTLLHYGYATQADRNTKFERYRSGRGHNVAHIDSIVRTPSLASWPGKVPM